MLKIKSFQVAFRGTIVAFKSEWNLRFHTLAGVGVIIMGYLLQISILDWIILLLCIAIVIIAELFNTVIEYLCNILRDKYKLPYEGSRDIRDISAGAVLIASIIATIVGVLVFVQYLF